MEYLIKNRGYYVAAITIAIVLCMIIPNSTPLGIIAAWILAEFKGYYDYQKNLNDDNSNNFNSKETHEKDVSKEPTLKSITKHEIDSKLAILENTFTQETLSDEYSKQYDFGKNIKYVFFGLLSLLLIPLLAWIIVNAILYFTNT